MNLRQKRLSNALQILAAETVLTFEQNHTHKYGIISVVATEITDDYSYIDIYISSQAEEATLPHFLAPSAELIKKRIAKEFSLRKIPIIRFKSGKKHDKGADILSLIHSLDTQYGLSLDKNP